MIKRTLGLGAILATQVSLSLASTHLSARNLVELIDATHKKELFFRGTINARNVDDLIKRLTSTLSSFPDQKVEIMIGLHSPGGEIKHAIRAIHFIKDLNRDPLVQIHTKVTRHSSCESACTILFTAGERRYAHLSSSFGFHSPKFQRGPRSGMTIEEIEDIFRQKWLGLVHLVDPILSERLRKEGYLLEEEMRYIFGRELQTGYVTDIL
jgi:ATP-dependent protease ClpP protease subunit